ncbi:hypothetical protein M378DRAFT_157266 [Amanita muscaria Koide BX008]|uniref:Uncharacterized protein n=1 Tax=Amanita muscaria (strain Koide BX008) TaxID=946122 RepID=A0A0C2TPB2_AMAMK|nr:hypothetical protein M378DRAFT_157266 [Amanita muscaria Koide BX008]
MTHPWQLITRSFSEHTQAVKHLSTGVQVKPEDVTTVTRSFFSLSKKQRVAAAADVLDSWLCSE